MILSAARTLSILACSLMLGCASSGGRDLEYDRVLDFAGHQLARGDAAAARQSLVEIRFKDGKTDQRREYFRLLGAVNQRLGSHEEAIEAFHRAREYRNGDEDREFLRGTAIGIARSSQGQQRWLAAERHLEEALGHSVSARERDEVYVLYAEGAVERRDDAAARGWLSRVSDRSRWGYEELERRLEASARAPRPRPLPSGGSVRTTPSAAPRPTVREPAPRPVRALAPRIFARQDWNARPLRASGHPEALERPWRITVHHAADKDLPTRRDEAAARMRSYQNGHFKRGWADIGYHYVIDGAGRVWEGRAMRWQGAHAGTAELNRGNIGVCLMGNFDERRPDPRQVAALEKLLVWLGERHEIGVERMIGHDEGLRGVEGKATACPGRYLRSALREMRQRLRAAR